MKISAVLLLAVVALAGCTTVVHQSSPPVATTVRVPTEQVELPFVLKHCIDAPYFGGIYQVKSRNGGTVPVFGIACLSNRDGFLLHILCMPNGTNCEVIPRQYGLRDDRDVDIERRLRWMANNYRR